MKKWFLALAIIFMAELQATSPAEAGMMSSMAFSGKVTASRLIWQSKALQEMGFNNTNSLNHLIRLLESLLYSGSNDSSGQHSISYLRF